MLQNPVEKLADQAVKTAVLTLATGERGMNAEIILHLVVIKKRKLYVAEGYESLFSYCCGELGFSKSTAYRRKVVAEKAEEFPQLIERLRDGRLQLCAAAAVAPQLEKGKEVELLDAVVGMSHREVEAFLVKRWRKPRPVQDVAVADAPKLELQPVALELGGERPTMRESFSVGDAPASVQRTIVKPLEGMANRVSVTLSDATLERLKRAKEILGAQADDDVLGKALDLLLEKVAPERRHARREARATRKARAPREASNNDSQPHEATKQSQPAPAKPKATQPRRAPAAVRDEALARDGNQCAFISTSGKRCTARTHLELDHVQPFALGGASTLENQRTLCRTHNVHYAEKTFGA